MEYETIPRRLYKFLLLDGMRVDRVRELVRKLEQTSPVLYDKQYHRKLVQDLKVALFDTEGELMKLKAQEEAIRKAEAEYQKGKQNAALI